VLQETGWSLLSNG